jgi:protein O-mannosyl-transferase
MGADSLAAACAVLWMVHPLDSEPVDHVSARTESMMAMCYLLTLYASIRAANESSRRGAWEAASLVSCALGMACKESMVTAPLMVALYHQVFSSEPWRDTLRSRRRLYIGLAATWLVLVAPAG